MWFSLSRKLDATKHIFDPSIAIFVLVTVLRHEVWSLHGDSKWSSVQFIVYLGIFFWRGYFFVQLDFVFRWNIQFTLFLAHGQGDKLDLGLLGRVSLDFSSCHHSPPLSLGSLQSAVNRCTAWPLTESDDTRCCKHTILTSWRWA
jgi:hypothetical protein